MGRCVDNANVDISLTFGDWSSAWNMIEKHVLTVLNVFKTHSRVDPSLGNDLQGCCHRGVAKKRPSGFGMKNALFTSGFFRLKSTQHLFFSTELRDFL